jgi:FlaA1/EpsC-like NDP-sugar epimerase
VRFGNVLGSAGSVVPIFREQIKRGGPVTVTHPDMTRYFMSIPEASQLVLSAASMGQGGEVFILDMGTPLSIVQLAEKMIRLSGFKPYEDIDIVFTGASPGEKLAEELAHTSEELQPTANPKIFVGTIPSLDPERVRGGMERLHELIDLGDDAGLRRFLNELLPEARLALPTGANES